MEKIFPQETNLLHWFRSYLKDHQFIIWLQSILAEIPNGFEATMQMRAELFAFVEENPEAIINKVAAFLAAMPQNGNSYTKLNHYLPILRWKHANRVWKDPNARTSQLAGFICSALSKGNMGVIGFEAGTVNVRVTIETPVFDKVYPIPDEWVHKPELTGSFLEQEASDELDYNPEAARCIAQPKLKLSPVWLERPHMEEPSDGDMEKMMAYTQYTVHLGPCLTETAQKIREFRNKYIRDYRGRFYAATCINHTANKQIRSLIMPAKAEKVSGTLRSIDTTGVVLPEL